MYLNSKLSIEERQVALEAGKFSQEYWNQCTKITPEILERCEDVREYGKKILFNSLSDEIKKYLTINE